MHKIKRVRKVRKIRIFLFEITRQREILIFLDISNFLISFNIIFISILKFAVYLSYFILIFL